MNSPVRLAINGRFTSARQTGVQRVARSLIRALDHTMSSSTAGSMSAEVLMPRGTDHRLKLTNIPVREVGRFKGQAWEQLEFPREAGAHSLLNLCNAAPLMRESAATMIHDAQVFLAPRSYSPQFVAWYKFSLPKIAARSKRVLTVSNFSRDMLEKYNISPIEHTDVIYNGVDHVLDIKGNPDALQKMGLAPGAYVVVFGSLQEHKNLRVILDAFQDPTLKDLQLLVIGDVDRASVMSGLNTPAPAGAVFAGRASDEDMRTFLEQATCMVYPSKTEGFGLPPLEAMTFGCPAIVAPTGALPEVCGEAVLYADPDDPQAWVAAISRVTHDSALRGTLVERGLSQAGKFTWRESGKRLSQIMQDIAG